MSDGCGRTCDLSSLRQCRLVTDPPQEVPDTVRLLEELGAAVEVDDEGQVRSITLDGLQYNDGMNAIFVALG